MFWGYARDLLSNPLFSIKKFLSSYSFFRVHQLDFYAHSEPILRDREESLRITLFRTQQERYGNTVARLIPLLVLQLRQLLMHLLGY